MSDGSITSAIKRHGLWAACGVGVGAAVAAGVASDALRRQGVELRRKGADAVAAVQGERTDDILNARQQYGLNLAALREQHKKELVEIALAVHQIAYCWGIQGMNVMSQTTTAATIVADLKAVLDQIVNKNPPYQIPKL